MVLVVLQILFQVIVGEGLKWQFSLRILLVNDSLVNELQGTEVSDWPRETSPSPYGDRGVIPGHYLA